MTLGRTGRIGALGVTLLVAACRQDQSVLFPSGVEAERIAFLFWVMTGFGAAILFGVMALAVLAMFGDRVRRDWLSRDAMIIGGGIVFPVAALTALLASGLYLMNSGSAATASGPALHIAVVGERWWWRVFYTDAEGRAVESANELRLPVGRPARIELTTADVIHSFWAPRLAGKLDMIPGRTNILTVTATEPGVSRGQCAEYCGGAHALMSFHVIAMDEPDFRAWLTREAGAAREPATEEERRGRDLFLSSGCGACHTIRGTSADGRIGPDLTHIGSRRSLAAATLPNSTEAFADWIRNNQHIKPENLMPPFDIFDDGEIRALSSYLASLR